MLPLSKLGETRPLKAENWNGNRNEPMEGNVLNSEFLTRSVSNRTKLLTIGCVLLVSTALILHASSSDNQQGVEKNELYHARRSKFNKWDLKEFVTFSDVSASSLNATVSGLGPGVPVGVAVFDCNNDGLDDILFPSGMASGATLQLFLNKGDFEFEEVAQSRGLRGEFPFTHGVVAFDMDNDGWVDIALSGQQYLIRMFRNVGDCQFVEVTEQAVPYMGLLASSGLPGVLANTGGVLAVGDFDHDGDLDLLVAPLGSVSPRLRLANTSPTLLLTNELNKTTGEFYFSTVEGGPFIPNLVGNICAASFEDVDEDGWDDIVLSSCRSLGMFNPTIVWKNVPYLTIVPQADVREFGNRRIFVDASSRFGLGPTGTSGLAMSHSWGDFNGDGHFDVVMSDTGNTLIPHPGRLLLSRWNSNSNSNSKRGGLPTFRNVGEQIGLTQNAFGWGTLLEDLDNDGWDDVIYQGQSLPAVDTGPPTIYKNVAGGKRVTGRRSLSLRQQFRMSVDEGFGLARGDFNNDGWVDYVVNPVTLCSPDGCNVRYLKMFKNNGNPKKERSRCTRNYLDIALRGDGVRTNYYGVNSMITVTIPKIGYRRTGKIRVGSSFASTHSSYAHFGVGICPPYSGSKVRATVVVRWSGSEKVQRRCNVRLNQKLIIKERVTPQLCQLPAEVGPCEALFQRWYYNGNTCEEFIYGGCGGNANNFLTQDLCSAACEASASSGNHN